ncbi:hypothetical protein MGMO_52c00050 [Methyloglobulus morosus KoM1]|uniref:DUF3616 domain-containing protein n=1 Tax=Methyloglobulus morosus KoM1 TaxID=1116472 RepID=V5DZD1_9GAMM|nr:DUF3616 domain-containing protein [Methyloglobulus morosus]ESS72651.1 hypothetical protein MGMO_52c00050 [Methyloglobulus morosus KoM1]
MTTNTIQEKKYFGISNPSGAVALNHNLFVVADDEDNVLRIYDKNVPDKPLQTISLSAVFKGIIADGEDLEIDLESAAEIEGIYFWLGSHSSSRTGEYREARHRLFAINIKAGVKGKFTVSPAGGIYTSLIRDLQDDSRFDRYHLGKAKKTHAKGLGGLSIEGLASTPDNGLLIGFRNPLSGGDIKKGRLEKGKALIVKLKNPFEVIHELKAKFADPIELDLDGLGIREITRRKNHKYLIVAGPYHENIATDDHKRKAFQLYKWSSKSGKLNHLKKKELDSLNIEAALFYPDNDDCVQLLSDDGGLAGANGFRSLSLTL